MDADEIDEILENQVDTLLSTVSRWDGLIDQLAEMQRLLEQYGPELIPHLPWERPSDIESEVVKVWQEVHLEQGQAHPLDDRLLAALAARMAVDARFGALGLRIFGARAHAIVLPLAQRLEPGDFRGKARCLGLTALYWGLQGWTLPDVFQRACDAGLLPQAPVPDFSVLANQEGADSSDPLLFLRALAEAGVALILDSEQGGEHDQLVQQLSRLSGSRFVPLGVTQSTRYLVPGRTGQEARKVSFEWQGVAYSFEVEYRGDLADTAAVVRTLNQVLTAAGRSERYFQLLDGDRQGFVFADTEAMNRLAGELLLFCFEAEELTQNHHHLKTKLEQALSA